jgi:GTP-binding protein Era
VVLFVVEAGNFTLGDARSGAAQAGHPRHPDRQQAGPGAPRGELAPWLRDMQQRHPFTEFMPISAKQPKDIERPCWQVCAKFLPEQPGFYGCRRTHRTAANASWPARWCRGSCSA